MIHQKIVILKKDEYGSGGKQEWNHFSVIGQMNYLDGATRPDIIFDVHQCANCSIYPQKPMNKLSEGLDAI